MNKLGDYLIFKNGSTSPERSPELPFPVFGSNGIIGNSASANVEIASVIIGRVGTYCGSVFYSPTPAHVTDNAMYATPIKSGQTQYWYYVLKNLNLHRLRHGSGQPLLNQTILKQIDFKAHPIEEQQGISATLGALDDKIESNHRAAKKLNQLADAIADRMLASEPTRSVRLSVLAHFNTRSLRKGQFDKIEYVDIKQTAHGFVKGTTIFDIPDAPSRARRLVQDGDVIYSTVRPNRHVFAPLYNPPKNLVVSTGFAVASPTALTGSSFLTYVFSDSTFAKYLASAAGGSAYPAVDVGVIESYEADIPQNVSALREYEESTIAMRRYAHEVREENRRLASLRDALLPVLMSGRIRVRVMEVSG